MTKNSELGPLSRRADLTMLAAALGALALGVGVPLFAADAQSADAASSGAMIFADHCAVCHGPQAAGIPGSFPSLHEQVVAFAKTPEGRDYLVMVVTTGLMGTLRVGGADYNGVMPAQSGLSEAEVAAVLGYLASNMGKPDSGAGKLSAVDVSASRARHADGSAQGTRALRPATDL